MPGWMLGGVGDSGVCLGTARASSSGEGGCEDKPREQQHRQIHGPWDLPGSLTHSSSRDHRLEWGGRGVPAPGWAGMSAWGCFGYGGAAMGYPTTLGCPTALCGSGPCPQPCLP